MTDKQIIIDGVDVSKCSYFNFTDEHYCDECSSEFGCAVCDERTNCYYKQLKRLEQENKELKEKNKNIKAHKDFLFKENDKLMRNNSIIRMALNEIKDITTNALAKQRQYKEDFIEIQDIINNIAKIQEKNTYRYALEEIRENKKHY